MIDFLAKVLGPIFVNFGVSEADFQAYLNQLSGYVYFAVVLLVVLIAALVLAGKAKKGFRHVIRWQAVLAFVAIVAVMVNVICYGPMYSNVSGFLNASKVELSDETAAQRRDLVRQILLPRLEFYSPCRTRDMRRTKL